MTSRSRRYGRGACLAAAAAFCLQAAAGSLPATVGDRALPSVADVVDRVTPSVVNIAAEAAPAAGTSPILRDPFFRQFFDPRRNPDANGGLSLGSGVVLDGARGLVVTNHHVIADARRVVVTLRDGRRLGARTLGVDPETDLAVLEVSASGLPSIETADPRRLRVGDFVMAIGNPFGLGQTVTSGIVSALGRSGLGIEGYEDFIQTDAAINVGNSGGALVDLAGRLVGINTAIIGPSGGNVGIGFAIPVDMMQGIVAQLVEFGEVRRGLLGVATQDFESPLGEAAAIAGAVVVATKAGSPAAAAGIQAGDVVVEVNDRPVDSAAKFHTVMGLIQPGERVELELLRAGDRLAVEARLAPRLEVRRASGAGDADAASRLDGASLSDVPGGTEAEGRILVRDVAEGSAAFVAGLRAGDRIVSADREPVGSLDALDAALAGSRGPLAIGLRRDGATLFVLLP